MDKKVKLLLLCGIWIFISVCVAVGYKFVYAPMKDKSEQKAQVEDQQKEIEEGQQLVTNTASESRYRHTLNFGIDSFSGYCVFRSDDFQKMLANKRIKYNLVDDGADYNKRLEALKNNEINMSVFTIDALIKASSKLTAVFVFSWRRICSTS